MIGAPRLGLGTLALTMSLGMVMMPKVDAQSRGGSPPWTSQVSGAAVGASQIWPALEVMNLSPLWATRGTPDGSGVGDWPEDLEPTDDSELWVPPLWAGDVLVSSLWVLDGIESEAISELPFRVQSKSIFAYDLDSGEVLLAYGADDQLPVASLTKLMSGLTVMAEQGDLDRPICLDGTSRPSWPGALTRLDEDLCTRGWDLLGAAMVRSDNGAALALASVVDLPYTPFVLRMNEVAEDLGMTSSRFTDPTGVEDTNLSTARDITRLAVASAFDPSMSTAASSAWWDVQAEDGSHVKRLHSTHPLHHRRGFQILAAKTGYTDTALHCFTAVVQLDNGRRVALTTLGARRSKYRWGDVDNILYWVSRSRG